MEERLGDRTPDTGHDLGASLSASAAAEALGLNERTIRRAIARGEFPAVKRGGVTGSRQRPSFATSACVALLAGMHIHQTPMSSI
jgi:excisionase family DNA binding protein